MRLHPPRTILAPLLGIGLAAGGAVAWAGTAPSFAGTAASIAVDRACYIEHSSSDAPAVITITGAGFTPGAAVAISGDGTAVHTVADANGAIHSSLPAAAVTQPPIVQPFTLTATDAAGVSASAQIYVTDLAVAAIPAIAHLHQKVQWSFSGFAPGREIYGHYLHDGRPVATADYGVAAGPCGTLSTRATEYPGADPRYSAYTVQWDQSRHYSPAAQPRFIAAYIVNCIDVISRHGASRDAQRGVAGRDPRQLRRGCPAPSCAGPSPSHRSPRRRPSRRRPRAACGPSSPPP